ncbi:MAG: SRPBCC family protein [Saccharospirillaceae bacterium]|nr:SRPBCC family protein [Pseudomonadales bacterium]NRB80422.1 SRPBCC family protein [Saccharospirillaceae bacterium]
MAHQVEKTIKVNVSSDKIWTVLKDFAAIENFAATITSSPIINNIESGLGAKRKCTFTDGSSLVEEIIEYNEGQGYTMLLTDYAYPLKSMVATMQVKTIDDNTSQITMKTQFVVKGGPLGWLMGVFLMKPMMSGVFKKVLSGLAYYSETGKKVDGKLPSNEELKMIIS